MDLESRRAEGPNAEAVGSPAENDRFYPTDDVIVVTGGAGQLGSAICERLDELGNDVVMADLDVEECDSRIDELGLSSTYPLELDVTDRASIRSGFAEVDAEFGGIDALVNNAGIAVFTPFRERTETEFDDVMQVNVYGTFFCTLEALSYMEPHEEGRIVNVGSIYGVVSADSSIYGDSGLDSSAVYAMSKAAVVHMTKYMATHVHPAISVNCVCPGGIYAGQDEYFLERYREKTPKGRMATEEDLVDTFAFLCSDSARYITGQNVVVDGGFTAW
jgi:NAD(P)-dependent dehydrogenase (short-subunit alcohol dehydrogenase family)